MKENLNKQSGFTIIEIALVLIVAGSMLAFLGSALLDFQKKKRINLTEYRLEKIRIGLDKYLTTRGRLPCPAATNINPELANYGREVTAVAGGDCTGTAAGNRAVGNIAGTVLLNGARAIPPDNAVNRVRIGSVPVRDLDLSDEMMVDGWGARFTYAVTINQATVDRFSAPEIRYLPNAGAIDIVGLGGSIFPAALANSAHYAVVSHGADQQGAVNITNGNVVVPCNPLNTPTGVPNIQNLNCVNDVIVAPAEARFLETLHRDDGSYDDFITYGAPSMENNDIPTGAVVPFRLQHCPQGWSVYEEARGRIIMSVVDADTTTAADDNIIRRKYDPFARNRGDLTLSATNGNITITSTGNDFNASDVGATIRARNEATATPGAYGFATVTAFTSATSVSANVTTNFDGTAYPESHWTITFDRQMGYPLNQTDATDPVSAQDQARYNIPPYLALLYCRKN